MTRMARQGDILLVEMKGAIPQGAHPVKREPGGIVLAYGEATGHAHRIRSRHVVMFENGDERYLKIEQPADLTHEEHGAIHLEPGLYRVVRQREYEPKRNPRWVDD